MTTPTPSSLLHDATPSTAVPASPAAARPPSVMSWFVGGAARLAPELAARWAARRFLTPNRLRPRPRDADVLARAERSTCELRGLRLAVFRWGDGDREAVLAHGWSGGAAQLTPFVEPLLACGFRVVAFDAPAHGASEGSVASVPAMADALRAVAGDHVEAIVAHSAGATAAALAVASGLVVERAALIAPAVRPTDWAHRFADHVGLPRTLHPRMWEALQSYADVPLAELDLRRLARRWSAATTIFHDRRDPVGDLGKLEEAARSLAARVVEVEGLGHYRIVRDDGVIGAAVAHLDGGSTEGPERATPRVAP